MFLLPVPVNHCDRWHSTRSGVEPHVVKLLCCLSRGFILNSLCVTLNPTTTDTHLTSTFTRPPAMTGADLARDKREGRQDSESSADKRCPVSKVLLEKSHKPHPKLDSRGGCFVPLGDPWERLPTCPSHFHQPYTAYSAAPCRLFAL